jgi:hypothetical protein
MKTVIIEGAVPLAGASAPKAGAAKSRKGRPGEQARGATAQVWRHWINLTFLRWFYPPYLRSGKGEREF